mgnify:CR=1 FL=1
MSCSQAIAYGVAANRHPLRRRVRGSCAMTKPTTSTDGRSKYVSAEVIAHEYDVPVSQVHRGAREGWLPVMKFGRYSRFDPERVKAELEGQGFVPQTEGSRGGEGK